MEAKTYPEYSTHYPLLLTNFMKNPLKLYPDDIGVVYRNEAGEYYRFTWRQWYERTCKLAHALKALGVKPGEPGHPGDRVAAMALNHHQHLELIYATVSIGAVSHPINIRLSRQHMAYTINHAEDAIMFVDETILPLLDMIYDEIKGTVKQFVLISDKPEKPQTRVQPLYNYEELIKDQPADFNWPYLHEDTRATLYYTTGTTGLPKGCLYSHRQIYLSSVHVILEALSQILIRHDLPWPRPPVIAPMINVPFFHIHAWGAPWHYVRAAYKMVLPGRFTPEVFCEVVQREKVTSTALVPTMLAMLIEYPDLKKWDLSSLQEIGIGGGALPKGLKAKAEALFPSLAAASSGYGMTETNAGVIRPSIMRYMADWPKEKLDEILIKTGLPIFGIEAMVVDENGKPVPRDDETVGEIIVRGNWITEQYFKDPERTANAWRDGWFHTGDAAKVNSEGYMTIVDRITDVIRSGSEMVPTVLLENLTATADFVLEATYVGVPDEKWGERPMALIKLMPGAKQTEADVIKFLETEGIDKGKITKWMLPDYVAFVDEIPKTSVGKFDKIATRKKLDEFLSKAKRIREL